MCKEIKLFLFFYSTSTIISIPYGFKFIIIINENDTVPWIKIDLFILHIILALYYIKNILLWKTFNDIYPVLMIIKNMFNSRYLNNSNIIIFYTPQFKKI